MPPTTMLPTPTTALNVGSGARPGGQLTFTYVDATAWPVDVAADARALPFRDEQFTYIHCSHLIEHVPQGQASSLLAELRRVIAPSGVLFISAPDMDRATAAESLEWIRLTKKGGARPGWEHLWTCTARKLRRLLVDAGFVPTWAKAIPSGWAANGHSWPPDFEARFLCRRDDFPWPRSFQNGMEVVL